MTKDEAWAIIEDCKKWNIGQKSWSFANGGIRTGEDDVLDAKRNALVEAWKTIGEADKS